MHYYHKCLNEGTDIRNEGLIWAIKAIWNLDHSVIPGYLPSFIDENTVIYLFDVKYKEYYNTIFISNF